MTAKKTCVGEVLESELTKVMRRISIARALEALAFLGFMVGLALSGAADKHYLKFLAISPDMEKPFLAAGLLCFAAAMVLTVVVGKLERRQEGLRIEL